MQTHPTDWVCPWNVRRQRPLAASHSFKVLSSLLDRTNRPSTLRHTEATLSVVPSERAYQPTRCGQFPHRPPRQLCSLRRPLSSPVPLSPLRRRRVPDLLALACTLAAMTMDRSRLLLGPC